MQNSMYEELFFIRVIIGKRYVRGRFLFPQRMKHFLPARQLKETFF